MTEKWTMSVIQALYTLSKQHQEHSVVLLRMWSISLFGVTWRIYEHEVNIGLEEISILGLVWKEEVEIRQRNMSTVTQGGDV